LNELKTILKINNTMKFKNYLLVLLCIIFRTGYSQDAKEFYKEGQKEYKFQRYKEAIEDYTKAIALDSTYMNAYIQRAFCKGMIQDFEGEIDDYTLALKIDPKHKFSYISRGSAKNKTKDYKGAIEDFNKALELDPTDQEAYNNRGFSKKGLNDMEGACEDWNKSKKMGNEEAKIILKNNRCK
jgi:tetratricopeptide (TPR) repeat protein